MALRRTAGVLALAAWAIGAGSSVDTAQADRPVPFRVGETLTYDVGWSTYLTAGTATLSVKERRPAANGAEYDLVAEGRPVGWLDRLYHAYYKAESMLNTRTLQPSIATVYSDERGRTELKSSLFRPPNLLEFRPTDSAPVEKHTVPAGTLDPLSAVYAIRGATLKAGQTITMSVVEDVAVYSVRWQVGAPEPIRTSLGSMSAWRLTPLLLDAKGKPVPDRKLVIWLTNDARRLPVKFDTDLPVGTFSFTLTRSSS